MEQLITILLIIHVAAGSISLLTGLSAIASKKGGKTHNLVGKIFFWNMAIVFVTALFISAYRFIPFLFFISVFSFYTILSAYRILKLKDLYNDGRPKYYDWIISGMALLFNGALVVYSIYLFSLYGYNNLATLSIIFGLGGLINVYGNTRPFYKKPVDRNFWLRYHIGNMMGGFIAATTAFSANTLMFMPVLIKWLWPAILGFPIIIYFTRKYAPKLPSLYADKTAI